MLSITIRFIFIIFCSIYTYNKLLNYDIVSHKEYVKDIVFSCLLASMAIYAFKISYTARLLYIFIFFLMYIFITKRSSWSVTLLTSVIAFLISYFSLSIVACLIIAVLTPITTGYTIAQSPAVIFIGGISQFIFIFLLFKKKRLSNGMPFLIYPKIAYAILAIFIFVIIILLASQNVFFNVYSIRLFTLITIIFLAIALLLWWRHKITQSYVEKLRVDEVELLYKEISDKDLEIEKLHAHNEQLSGIIHKDNKLIPAMEMAVRNYLQTATLMKPEDARQTGAELLGKLERMAEERTGIIHTYQENFSYRQSSGLISIDAIVDYMENRASTLGIEYHYQFDKTLKEMLPAFITEDDAMHLLSDLIENAIIAASHSEKKNIHIHIGFIRSILFIDISDSGIPFTPETYENFGNIQYTTHAEHGGSGIGLMDIAKLKKQYQFSLQIYEYPENETIYTKKIRILFDRKAHYLIQSYRAKELHSAILRNDLHVIPYSDKEKP